MSKTARALPPTQRSALQRFLNGQSDFDVVGRSRLWLIISVGLVLACFVGLLARGLNFGIDFTGGTSFVLEGVNETVDAEEVRDALGAVGVRESIVQFVDSEAGRGLQVSTPDVEEVAGTERDQIIAALTALTGVTREQVDVNAVGPRWGAQISRQALEGLAVFLILVVIYITIRFDLRMAIAALVTLLHDIVVTIGIYAIVGFQVSPASVIALLTILGYSLSDTVVVFDRVTENTERLGSASSRTYGEVANEALNQVFVRSLSTSITSLLPVGALLFIGANLLGAETLSDLALALFVGMGIGTYSSLVVAAPLLVWLKEREPRYAELKQRLSTRRRRVV
ncbi:MAG: protein translocase subunit SecF [Egibacteraceae bacterium]